MRCIVLGYSFCRRNCMRHVKKSLSCVLKKQVHGKNLTNNKGLEWGREIKIELFIRFLEQLFVREGLLSDSQRRLGKLRNMPKTVRKKSNKLLFSWTLMSLQVRHTLFDREVENESNPGRIWRISGTCQNGHGTKPAASTGGWKGPAKRKMSVTARSQIRSVSS